MTRQRLKNAGIARIVYRGDDERTVEHAGMAIVVGRRHLLTCAHVVNVALDREADHAEIPDKSKHLEIRFPLLAKHEAVYATVKKWAPVGKEPRSDIALLELESDVPEDVGSAIFADITGIPLDDDALSIFGIRANQWLGHHLPAQFGGSTTAAWVQVDGVDPRKDFVEPGFSGAAVWDSVHSAVVGMMVRRNTAAEARIAYMLPMSDLLHFYSKLPVEQRPLRLSYNRTWTIYASLFFFLIFVHFATERGVRSPQFFAVEGGNKFLATYWGLNIYAILAPFGLWWLIRFGRAYRHHEWYERVPSFGSLRLVPGSSSTRLSASTSLFTFVFLPLVAQIHFITQFSDQGHVYANARKFGYDISENIINVRGHQYDCIDDLCDYPGMGRLTLLRPREGIPAPFFDDAYRYGSLRKDHLYGTTTYFPILHPILLTVMTTASVTMILILLLIVFRERPSSYLFHDD